MNILFLGKPGSGKGTIAQKLLEGNSDFIQLSTGDLLRQEQETGSEMGKKIEALLKDGQFATDEMITVIVDKFMKDNADKSIIFDGYPRTVSQADNCLKSGIVFDKTFFIDVSDDVVKERIVNRRVHLASGRVYNIETKKPKVEGIDDVTGEPLTHRNDDHPEVLDNRLKNYQVKTFPIVAFLESEGLKVNTINGAIPVLEQMKQVNEVLSDLPPKKKLKM
jgi:adenylate kinase